MAYFIKDPAGWLWLTRSPNGPFAEHMRRAGKELEIRAKKQVGVDTGNLRRSIGTTINYFAPRGILVTVGSANKIALLHHEGTRAHEIRPRRAKVLRFVHRGVVRYETRVWHPGTKPNRYLTDNLRKVV